MKSAYLRNLVTEFPKAALASWHAHGFVGLWLATCVFVLRRMPWSLRLAHGLHLENWHEAVNYLDNFVLRELRNDEVEAMLGRDGGGVIEVGVNIGITSRWWLSLHPDIRVTGIDMMQEALDHTTRSIATQGDTARWACVSGAVGDHEGKMEIFFDDPLEGTNSLDQLAGGQKREVEVNTLDVYLARQPFRESRMLKLDIEGHAAAALRGASTLLGSLLWVVIETHHAMEISESAEILTRHGFLLRHFHGRTMWWRHQER